MAQATDYNLANQTGADFRAELNEILAASVSLNSGSSEPTTMYAHQLWVDTSSNELKIRNAANNAWLTTGVSITSSNSFVISSGSINGITSLSFSSGATVASILDEDNLSSDSATALATQQSIKAYVDSQVTAQDLDITDGSSTIAIDLDSETLSLLGGTGITSTASGNGVTFAIGQSVGTSDNVVFNQVTGALVGNASTATTLATARTISGVSFNGSANITLDTDDIGEGSTNLYYTDARFDTRLASKTTSNLTEGSNLYYADSRARAAISENSAQLSYNSGTGVLTYTQGDTDTVSEGSSNLYYTDARANSAIDARVTNTFINNLSGVVADTATALATARTIALSGDVAGSVSFNGTSDVTISSTIQANSVALGTDTTGNYVATITGTANKVSVSGSGSETAGVTLSLPDDVQIADSLTVAGNLTVNGTLTSLDTTNLDIEDNLFQLNAGLTGSPVNDSGMLINRGNQNNGIFMWDESADKFTMGLTTADGTSTGNITLASLGTLVANLEGNVTGDVTGNVSGTAATVTGAAQTAITSVGTLTGLTTTGNINLGDNDKAIFGAGSDLQIYHDGSNSYIQSATGGFNITTAGGNEFALTAVNDGAVTLYHNGNPKLATTSGGIDVTGTVVSSGAKIVESSGATLDINTNANGADSKILLHEGTSASPANGASIRYDGANNLFKIGVGSSVDTTRLTIARDTGNLGLGTDSPARNLSIVDTSAPHIQLALSNDQAASSGFEIAYDGSANYIAGRENVPTLFTTNNTTALTLDASQNATFSGTAQATRLGLGVAPHSTAGLNITSTNQNIRLNNGSELAIIDLDANGALKLWSHGDVSNNEILFYQGSGSGSESMRIDGSGNLILKGGQELRLNRGDNNTYGSIKYLTGSGGLQLNDQNSDGITFIRAGSSESMRIDSSGKVGIGTTSPSEILHVQGDGADILITDAGGGEMAKLGATGSNNGILELKNNSHSSKVFLNTSGDSYLNSGKVGISTSSPNANLHVGSASATGDATNPAIQIGGASTYRLGMYTSAEGAVIENKNGDDGIQFRVKTAGEAMRLDASGNLGLGTNNPSMELDCRNDGTNGIAEIGVRGGTGGAGAIQISGHGTTYGSTSFDLIQNSSGAFIQHRANLPLMFATNNTERMRIDGSGNLGLGTSSPAQKLHVVGGQARFDDHISIQPTKKLFLDGGNDTYIDEVAANTIAFNSGGAERLRITSGGNVQIADTGKLVTKKTSGEVIRFERSSDDLRYSSIHANSTDGGGAFIQFKVHTGASATSTADVMTLMGSGRVGIGTSSPATPLHIESTSIPQLRVAFNGSNYQNISYEGSDIYGGSQTFKIAGSEKMRLNSSGSLLINETNSSPSNIGSHYLVVQRSTSLQAGAAFGMNTGGDVASRQQVTFFNANGTVGTIFTSGSSTAYNTSSDARLKDVTGEARGLEVINALNPVAYKWKADGNADEGLIAQEVMDIVPNAVSGSEEDMYQMDYSKLVVHLVAGMKEQQKQIEELKTQIQNLKGE